MGLSDITSRVLTVYSADAKEQIAELKKLKGAINENQRAELEAHEARNAQAESWLKNMAKIGAAMGVVKLAFDGLKDYGHRLDLEATAAGVSIEGLSKAASGLKTNMELLEHAAVFNKSAFKLTQEQMETAERAMHALEERGRSSEEVWQAVSAAVTKGTTRSLEQFGVIVDKTGLQMDENGIKLDTYGQRAEALKRVMAALAKVSGEVVDGQHDAADAVEATIVQFKNAWDEAKQGLGQIVIALKPILELLAAAVNMAGQLVRGLTSQIDLPAQLAAAAKAKGQNVTPDQVRAMLGGNGPSAIDTFMAGSFAAAATGPSIFGDKRFADVSQFGPGGAGPAYASFGEQPGAHTVAREQLTEEAKKAAAELAEFTRWLNQGAGTRNMPALNLPGFNAASLGSVDSSQFDAASQALADLERKQYLATADARYADSATQRNEPKLAKIFGPLSDFDLYQEAFKALSGAVSASMNAWIDGSMSAGQAFKKFIADALKGLASQMLIESLKHGAYALGSLAFGDPRGAAQHGEAAAAFGAGAIAAAVAAKELGGSGGSSGSRPSAPNVGGSAGGGGGVQTQQTVLIYGDSFSDDSPRMRQIKAQKIVGAALGGSAVSDG